MTDMTRAVQVGAGTFGWLSLLTFVIPSLTNCIYSRQGRLQVMSHSPTASLSNSSESIPKKRKTMGSGDLSMAASSQQQPHIPKRGARACTSCRKGKNRCEGEVRPVFLVHVHSQRPVITVPGPALYPQAPCRRCQASGTPCIFEKPEKKNVQGLSTASVEYGLPFFCCHLWVSSFCRRRLSRLEGQYLVLLATFL